MDVSPRDLPLAAELPPTLVEELTLLLGERFTQSPGVCAHHGHDESHFPDRPPQAVAFVESREEIAALLRACSAHRVPVIPFGAGSSLEGHVLAVHGGIALDCTRMDRILEIEPADMLAVVQPGVTRKQLNNALRGTGLFFPIDPGADASIGGMTATRASGTKAVRYGTMRENVLALQAVTASGDLIRTGNRAKKSAAGYDLTRLLVGSEGTLGIFTEITLRLHPLPEAVRAATCTFASIADAVHTVIETIQLGVPIARVELLDAATVGMVNRYSQLSLREAPMLLMEFHGSPAGVQEQVEQVQAIAAEHRAQDFEWAETPEERTRLFTARHNAYFAGVQSRPGSRCITTDACVPISRLADALLESVQDAQDSAIPFFLVGHVGDGNFHFGYLIDPDDAAERDRAEQLNHRLVSRAIAMDGTCTGEHGIGIHKQDFLREECGDGAIAMMRAIKTALDPQGILNPGKIF